MLRLNCTICNNTNLQLIHRQENYPICISSSSQPSENDRFETLEYVGCEKCGCVQLKNLIDPQLLYAFSHNNTYETPTWRQHHDEFSQFILMNTEEASLVEIGGASGYLGELLHKKSKELKYTIIDLANKPELKVRIDYIQANCEDYDFTQIPSSTPIILSHVFEHLYNPQKFLENLKKAKTETLFISIPNMEICLSKKFLSFLHVEHTYYCSTEHIVAMLASAGFQCSKQYLFKEHSIFFEFKRSTSREIPELPRADILLAQFQQYYSERESLFKLVHLENPTYIVPAGHYGQLIYFFLREQKDKILGFLDNDITKVGKRVYGTDKYVYSMSELKNKTNERITVLLNAGPYINEIKSQLLAYNPGISFLYV